MPRPPVAHPEAAIALPVNWWVIYGEFK